MLLGTHKPVIVFDGSCASSIRYEDCWVSSFNPRDVNLATAEGVPVPHNPLQAPSTTLPLRYLHPQEQEKAIFF